MGESVLVAIITGCVTMAGTILTVVTTNRKTKQSYEVNQAVMQEQITNLTNEVKKHNEYGEKIPRIDERLNALENRVSRLEDK